MVLLGAFPAYQLYIKKKIDPIKIVSSYRSLQFIHRFLWNRWYMDRFYNKVFVDGVLSTRKPVVKYIERPMDKLLNEMVPNLFFWLREPVVKYIERPMDIFFHKIIPQQAIVVSIIGHKFDAYVIDGVANSIASTSQVISRISRTIQRGVTEEYILAFILGIISLAFLMLYLMIFGG